MRKLSTGIAVALLFIGLVILFSGYYESKINNQNASESNYIESRASRVSSQRKINKSQPPSTQSTGVGAEFSEFVRQGNTRGFHDKAISDPQSVIDYIEQNFESIDPKLRQGYARLALQAIARVSPELALQWASQSKIFCSERDAVQTVFSAWEMKSEDDVKLALSHASAFKSREWADSFIPDTVVALAHYSNKDALDWIKENLGNNIEIYRQSLQGVFLNIADNDPSVFWQTIGEFESDPLVTKSASIALINLSIKNIDAAENLLTVIRSSHDSDFVKDAGSYVNTINSIARQNIVENPDKVLNLLINSGINEKAAYEIFGNNMFYWVRESPEKALDWLNSREESEKIALLSNYNVISSIAEFSPEKAISSIEAQGLPMEQEIRGYNATLQVWSASSPSAAFEWISLKEPDTQRKVIDSFVNGMFSIAPDLVNSYLASPSIANEAREQGLQILKQLGTKK